MRRTKPDLTPNAPVYLIEDFQPEWDTTDGIVVSLTPEASYQCQKSDIPYFILEDFYDEKELLEKEDSFLWDQADWIKRFDRMLQDKIAFCKQKELHLVSAQYYRVKFFVDTLVIQSFFLRKFLEKTRPERVLYVGGRAPASWTNFSLHEIYGNQRRFLRILAEMACKRENIPFRAICRSERPCHSEPPFSRGQAPRRVSLYLKSLYCFLKFQKYHRYLNRKKRLASKSVLFIHMGRETAHLVPKLIREGAKVFVKEGMSVDAIDRFIHRRALNLETEAAVVKNQLQSAFKNASQTLSENSEIIQWVNAHCGMDVSSITLPFFHYFIFPICCEIAAESDVLARFYKRMGITGVIARSGIELLSVSSLVAAEQTARTRRICFQHGSEAIDSPILLIHEADRFDAYFASESDTREYLKEAKRYPFIRTCEGIYEYSQFFKTRQHRKKRGTARRKEVIYYAPQKVLSGVCRLNHMLYSATPYYEFQMALLNYFSKRTDKQFVFKYKIPGDWLQDSTLSALKSPRYSNISVSSRPMEACLSDADRVILDYPGTTLYWAASVGKPVLAVFPDRLKVRQTSQNYFSSVLRPFSDVEEALHHVEKFLDADPESCRPRFPMTSQNAFAQLARIL